MPCFEVLAAHPAINIASTVEKNLSNISNFALYLVAPQYLDIGICKFFASITNTNSIKEHNFVVCQLDSDGAPPYTLRVPERPLPVAQLHTWITTPLEMELWPTDKEMWHLSFDVSSGVDETLLSRNLSALANLPKTKFIEDNKPVQTFSTYYFVANVLLSWFVSMGISVEEVKQWLILCIDAHFEDRRVKDANAMYPDANANIYKLNEFFVVCSKFSPTFKEPTLYPLPSFIDVRMRTTAGHFALYGTSQEEILHTFQFFSTYLSIIPGVPSISMDKIAPLDSLKSGKEVDLLPKYWTLDADSARILGDFIGSKCTTSATAFLAQNYLEDLLSSFCQSLNMVLHQRIHNNIDRRSVTRKMLNAFLDAFARIVNSKERRAILTRCLVSRISLTRSQNSSDLIDQLLQLCSEKDICFCEHTIGELRWMSDRGFTDLKSIDLYKTRNTFKLPLVVATDPVVLKYSTLQNFELTVNSTQHLQPQATKPNSPTTTAVNPPTLEATNLYQSSYKPVLVAQKTAQTLDSPLPDSNSTDDIPISSLGNDILKNGQCIIHCHQLLRVVKHEKYATLLVRPGMAGYLIRHSTNTSLFCFVSSMSWQKLCDNYYPNAQNPELFKGAIVASYADYGEAWEMISTSCSPLTLIALDGLFLKKTSNNWVPVIIGHNTNIADFTRDDSIESEVSIWHILDLYNLLSYEMEPSVIRLLKFLCKCVWKEAGNKSTNGYLLDEFRDLDIPEDEERLNNAKIAKRIKVKQIYTQIRDVMINILEQISSKEVKRSYDVIQQAFNNSFKHINKSELETHILKSMAHAPQVRKILTSEFGLEIFFGKKAVVANSDLVFNVIGNQNTRYKVGQDFEWSDKIFEDEEDAKPSSNPDAKEDHADHNSSFMGREGFGAPSQELSQILSMLGPHPPLYYYFLDRVVHKPKYTPDSGCLLAYILNKELFKFGESMKDKMAEWFLNVLRSPLSDDSKTWFLRMSHQRFGEAPPSIEPVTEGAVAAASVISYCLGKACPHPVLQQALTGACPLPPSVSPFCQRRDYKYGVFFCNTSTLRSMRDVGLWVEVVDLGAAYATGIATIDELYLKIIGSFNAFTCFVYVQGLPSIADLFLKWCCEYTQRCPWRFIYFENTDNSHNFSENRDRCNDSMFLHPSLGESLENHHASNTDIYSVNYRLQQQGGNLENVLKECLPELSSSAIDSRYISDWENRIRDTLAHYNQFVVFVESPPGAGKTHLMEEIIEIEKKKKNKCERVDCSNDELVERAMESVLTLHFPEEVKKSILVADEFHMLSEEHKLQLMAWIRPRLNWLRVFIIANRSNDFDDHLLQILRKQSGQQVHVDKMLCRLDVAKIFTIFPQQDRKIKKFLKMWHSSARALFGDESISLRHVRKLLDIMQNTTTLPNFELLTFFQSKMPSLGSYMCEQFINSILHFYTLKCKGTLDLPAKTPFSSPVHLLVQTSLLCDKTATFPEFVRSLKGGMKVHPILRLAAWVIRTHEARRVPVPAMDCLKQLKIVDQIGFPLVVDIGSNSSLQSCDAFAQRGNYNNLKWMHETLTHGYAINWSEVKLVWKTHFITNSKLFEELLSVCPNPAACLQAVDPKNMSVLIESGSHRLAQMVVEFFEDDKTRASHDLNEPDSPYYSAAWFLLRHQDVPFSLEPLRSRGVDELKVLLWASRFGFHALYVKDQTKERNEFLQEILVHSTTNLVYQIDTLRADASQANRIRDLENQIIVLWSHIFSPLLKVGTKHGGVPHYVTLLLAAHQFPPKPDWPLLVKYLSSVIHGKAEKIQAEYLLESDLFYRLNERDEDDQDHSFTLPTGKLGLRFINGILTVGPPGAILSRKWQHHLLTTENVVIPDQMCNPKALIQLEQGLVTLRDPSYILIAPGKVRTYLESHRVFSKAIDPATTSHDQRRQISMAEKKQTKHSLRFLKNVTENPKILDYYNIYAGQDWETIASSQTEAFKLDKYNNPIGDEFDLGKTGAFREFRILIGNFFQRGEFNAALFKKYAQAALERKGFNVTLVNSEAEFIRLLDQYDIAWLISSDALDWNMRNNSIVDVTQWRRLADACEAFYKSGRGLFIFADNTPFLDHASIVLERLFGVKLIGNTPAKKVLHVSKTNDPTRGTFCGTHLIGAALKTLFEGDTVCFPDVANTRAKGLHVFAQSTDNQPVILYGENDKGGRVVVDTGFTKLWVEWDSAGTDRYVCNATVWLLGLDYRLNHMLPLHGATCSVPKIVGNTPSVAPQEAKSGKANVVLVVDGSGSVNAQQFNQMKVFSKKLAAQLVKPNVVNFGIVQFSDVAREECRMTSTVSKINQQINNIKQMRQGTNFDAGLEEARRMLLGGESRASKIIIFQTDGQGSTTRAPHLRNVDKIVIYAIGVGFDVDVEQLRALAGSQQNTLMCTSYDQLLQKIQKVVGEVARSTSS